MTILEVHDYKTPAATIADSIQIHLNNSQPVLWLVSGGSALKLIPIVRNNLDLTEEGLLHIGLIDERYGDVGHPDSNWKKLQDTDFEFTHVTSHPILTGQSLETTAEEYNTEISKHISEDCYVVAVIGIGADGHTAGMLPTETADEFKKFEETSLYTGYVGPDFVRVTATSALLARCNRVFGYAEGPAKLKQIERLSETIPAHEQPAQILKNANDATVFINKTGVVT